jgi:uncharacterized protein (UPF0261 family)
MKTLGIGSMSQAKRIAVVCTLDTKGEHARLVKSLIEGRDREAVLIGVLGEPALRPQSLAVRSPAQAEWWRRG